MKRTKNNLSTNLNVRLTKEFMDQIYSYVNPNEIRLSVFARKAIERAIPKKVILDELCPICKNKVYFQKVYPSPLTRLLSNNTFIASNYCNHCGTALDWSEYELGEDVGR